MGSLSGADGGESLGPEFNNDFCSNRGKQVADFAKTIPSSFLALAGFSEVYDMGVPSDFDKLKSDISSVQNATQQFINQASFNISKILDDEIEQAIAHTDLSTQLTENIMSVNDEILQEQITMNTLYIFVLYTVFLIIFIYVYIKV